MEDQKPAPVKKPKPTTQERLDKLLKREAALKQSIANNKAKISKENRSKDTRKKILIGALMMSDHIDLKAKNWLNGLLNGYLTSNRDRALFDLELFPTVSDDQLPPVIEEVKSTEQNRILRPYKP